VILGGVVAGAVAVNATVNTSVAAVLLTHTGAMPFTVNAATDAVEV
jgi:copper homeostasis protein CutC